MSAAGAARTGAQRPFVYAALPRYRRFFFCLYDQKKRRIGSPLFVLVFDFETIFAKGIVYEMGIRVRDDINL